VLSTKSTTISRPPCEHEGCAREADHQVVFAKTDEAGRSIEQRPLKELCHEHYEQEHPDRGEGWTSFRRTYVPDGIKTRDIARSGLSEDEQAACRGRLERRLCDGYLRLKSQTTPPLAVKFVS
jgi:hypothetical protein